MTQKAALCMALLKGEVLSIMVGFKWFSVTNVPREVSRQIEQPFGVAISRTKKEFISKYGQSGYYFEYRLNRTEYNLPGIEKMEEYIKEVTQEYFSPKVKRGAKTIHVKTYEPELTENLTTTENKFQQLPLF